MPRREKYKPAPPITDLIPYPQTPEQQEEWKRVLAQFAQPLKIYTNRIFQSHHPKIITAKLPEAIEQTLILVDGQGSRVGNLTRILNTDSGPYPSLKHYH